MLVLPTTAALIRAEWFLLLPRHKVAGSRPAPETASWWWLAKTTPPSAQCNAAPRRVSIRQPGLLHTTHWNNAILAQSMASRGLDCS